MMIGKELNDAINAQIGAEFGSSLQYVAIAAYFDGEALKKLAALFYKQAEEENEHAMKFIKYLVDTGGEVRIPAVAAPKATFSSAEEAVKLSLDWELEVTRQINGLYDIAKAMNDYAGQNFLDWFVEEQVEEVNSMDNLLKIVRHVGEKNIIMMEAYLSHGG
ncbi:MAG TPA: ferritin [Bellilinea sp.]|nr:ferritin [Bellilinea sp.]